jgi:hypothetical protein
VQSVAWRYNPRRIAYKEAVAMEFTIDCPVDGPITVALEDIDTVVLRDSERADITFVCPECGSEITVTAVVPSFLLAAIEALAEEGDATGGAFAGIIQSASDPDSDEQAPTSSMESAVAEAYCEYFRRQLAHVECVEDVLHEIDAAR